MKFPPLATANGHWSFWPLRVISRINPSPVPAWLACQLVWWGLAGLLVCPPQTMGAATTAAEPLLNDPVAGQEIAAHIRSLQAAEKMTVRGLMKIKRPGQELELVPFAFKTLPDESSWKAIYEIGGVGSAKPQVYAITHAEGKTNRYEILEAGTPGGAREVGPSEPLGTGDFQLGDLGLEFVFWPRQVLLKKDMKSNRACRVLESRPATDLADQGYSRVVSWVDNETHGILQANAYDASQKVVKEFRLVSFRKVNDRWQLEEMEMSHLRAKTRTKLTFDLDDQK